MQSVNQSVVVSSKAIWAGRIISALIVAFLLLDASIKLLGLTPAVEATTRLGYSENTVFGIGVLLLACTVIYAIPQTAFFGAILLTGYLGGAIATHVRVGAELLPIIFPAILAALAWLGLYLRDNRIRALIQLRN